VNVDDRTAPYGRFDVSAFKACTHKMSQPILDKCIEVDCDESYLRIVLDKIIGSAGVGEHFAGYRVGLTARPLAG
jgi:hypothetical protein